MKTLVPYSMCLALVTYAHAATVDTGYRPSTDGYRFQNFGGNILVTLPILNISVPSSGNCYGFSARSVDHFHYTIPMPANTTRTSAQEDDLISRQWDWSTELVFAAQQMGSAMLGINTMAGDYQWLKTKLETGKPWPIFVSGEPTMYAIGGPYPVIHVLLAYKIVENYQGISGRQAIFLYDSNYPQKDDVIALVRPANNVFQLNSYWDFYWFTTMRSYTPSLPNDELVNAIVVGGSTGQTFGANIDGSKEIGEPNHAGNAGGKSVWWRWTAPSSGPVIINTFGSTFDTLLAVHTGTSVGSLTHIASNDDSGGAQSHVQFNAVAGTIYRIAVDGYNGASGSITLNWNQNSPPATPTLTSPANGATGVSVTPSLQASAFSDPDGDSHANSQWQVDNNSNFSSPEWDSGESYVASTSATVPSGRLTGNTTYYWRVRYKDNRGAWSTWSTSRSFTTEVIPLVIQIPEIGSDGKAHIRWSSEVGRSYSLFCSEDLITGFSLLQSGIPATPPVNTYEDVFSGRKQRFWKVEQE